MSFDLKDLKVGDVFAAPGAEYAAILSSGLISLDEFNITRMGPQDVSQTIIVYVGASAIHGRAQYIPEAERIFPVRRLRHHITRVLRDGQQIYPPPESKFRHGDIVEWHGSRFRIDAKPRARLGHQCLYTLDGTVFCAVAPESEVTLIDREEKE